MSRIADVAKRIFNRYPLVANSLVYGTLYVGAEFSQQTLTRKLLTDTPQDIDRNVLGRYTVMGACICSPILYNWYRWLDKTYKGTAPRIIVKKLLLDQFILTPPLLVIFFIGMSFMERKDDLFAECKSKWLATFQTSCMFWLPAQTVNFIVVPPAMRVVYVGCCAFIWVNILCWIKRQGHTDTPSLQTTQDYD